MPTTTKRPIYIYGLVDPRSSIVRYVGSTVNLKTRYQTHLRERMGVKKVAWIDELKSEGLKPTLKVLETLNIGSEEPAEAKWIQHFKHKGVDLTNNDSTHESNHLKVTKEIEWSNIKQHLLDKAVQRLNDIGVIPKGTVKAVAESIAILHILESFGNKL